MRLVLPGILLLLVGCAKYNTYYNAKRSFDTAENMREEALKKHEDLKTPAGAQRQGYEEAIVKAQKILDDYPGHNLTDDALFLQAKSHHRLEAYRQSIRKLDLLFQNFPATPYLEESLYLQGLNYLLIGALGKSQDYLDRLAKSYPKSKYQAETRKVSGDNAFALQDWETASVAYAEYLALDSEVAERDRVGLKLAECYWELENFYGAAEVLQEVSQDTESAELAFRSRLLRARVHVQMEDFEIVELLTAQLREEASIYSAEGDVLLVEAESLIAQGKSDEAAPRLESMPDEWAKKPGVKARAAEILGRIFLDRGEWERARESFQSAVVKRDVLEDEDYVRRVNDNLKDYLAAEQALPDAKGERVASLKLLQANSLLFGFERPHMAATLYGEAGADTAAAEAVAARSLYGAYLTYDRYLDLPDSAMLFRNVLLERFPDSPQAYEATADTSTNLLGYLLAIRSAEQAVNLADLSADELAALEELSDVGRAGVVSGARAMEGVRRRMVYLSRRDNRMFDPPQAVVELISERQKERILKQAQDEFEKAQFDSLRTLEQGGTVPAGAVGAAGDLGPPTTGDLKAPARASELDAGTSPLTTENPTGKAADDQAGTQGEKQDKEQDEEQDKKDAEDAEKEKKKKKQDENWDFLR